MHMQVGDMARPPLPLDRARCIEIADTCTQFNVRKAARAIGQIFDEALRPSGLRGTQFSLLIAVSVLERATVARLAEALQLDPTTLTRNLAPLEREGLVASEPGDDGRERWIVLTDVGTRRLSDAIARWDGAQRAVIEAMGRRPWIDLITGLKAAAALGTAGGPTSTETSRRGARTPRGNEGPRRARR